MRNANASSRNRAIDNHVGRQFSIADVEEALTRVDSGAPLERQLAYAKSEASRVHLTLRRLPSGDDGKRLLDVGICAQWIGAYVNLLGYRDITGIALEEGFGTGKTLPKKNLPDFALAIDFLDAEKEPFPYPDASFDVVVCCSMLEHLVLDPMHMMSEISRVTKAGGLLCLQTPNSASLGTLKRALLGRQQPASYSPYFAIDIHRHNREYTPSELSRVAQAGGFEIASVDTFIQISPAWQRWVMTMLAFAAAQAGACPLRFRGERAMVCGRKKTPVVNRWPSWLYENPWLDEGWYRAHGALGKRRLDEWRS